MVAAQGEGPRSFKLGKTVFYDADDVAEWVEAQKAATAKRNFSRWMSPVGVRRLSWRSPGWCSGLVG